MSNALASLVGGAADGYDTAALAKMTEAQRLAWYKKMGIEPPPVKPSPLSRAVKWVGDKLAATPPATPVATGDSVGLVERLKAGNIDQVGSEAYNRWGQGKVDGDAATPGDAPAPVAAPPAVNPADIDHFDTKTWNEMLNVERSTGADPMWDDLPGDEYAMKQGA